MECYIQVQNKLKFFSFEEIVNLIFQNESKWKKVGNVHKRLYTLKNLTSEDRKKFQERSKEEEDKKRSKV